VLECYQKGDNMNKIKTLILILAVVTGLSVCSEPIQTRILANNNTSSIQQQVQTYTSPLDIVARPNFYLNKNVKIKAKFDKFSTLGLDYKPALRSSEKYISFLIQRPDITDHNIPLSELKIFIDREVAEKYIDLNSGDVVEFSGKVFSTALGDPWLDATNFTVISTKPKAK
jgi:hypothetical protein